ncbi:MAG: L-2-amino-thiazoline-4-carboxylic acid hydrolase [Dehalococcoidia bacterium]|nr:L-2-amino-thiazoline-4-carboxylic acid hydrolase [Dehalococcoidia bacterium]
MRTATAADLPLLERRRLEAALLVPLIRALQAEFGVEPVNRVVAATIQAIARAQGEADRARHPTRTLADLAERIQTGILAEGSLTAEVIAADDTTLAFDVTRCRFMEMYDEMGARDLGVLLSCGRDLAFFAGLAPAVQFNRTQTRMEGAPVCDFRYAGPPP